jgi:hypothetical protein
MVARERTILENADQLANADQVAAEQLFSALARWDLDAYASLLADAAVEGRPQMGEQFVGRANILSMYRMYPLGPPTITWRRVRGSGPLWVGEGIIQYGAGPVHLVGIVEIQDGTVIRADFYMAEAIQQPVHHARWAESA